jgi:hypothetical protein
MIKKIILVHSLLLLLTVNMFAKQVDESTAKSVAQNFLSTQSNLKINRNQLNLNLAYKAQSATRSKDGKAENYFYVFNNESKGFVIVSADDAATPILGYSDEGVFDANDMPSNAQNWLKGYEEQIKYIIANEVATNKEVENQWQQLKEGNSATRGALSATSVAPLLKTQWNQGQYYNDLCPYDEKSDYANKRVPIGCVVTAMAQVMKYWNYPVNGIGSHSYSHNKYGTLSADFANTTYDWNSMPNKATSPNTALATLIYHCGVSVNMNYGPDGSGAQVSEVVDALSGYFKYSSSIKLISRTDHTDEEWLSKLTDELDSKRVVYYSGRHFKTGVGADTVSAGHAFVFDGYDNNKLFHVNWGWGGKHDGYFQVQTLNSDDHWKWNNTNSAIIGIQPGAPITTNSCANEYEPNESISSAKAISSGSSIKAAIGSSGDNDYFSINLPSNGTLDVELTLPGIDLDFHVYNSSGTEVGKAVNGSTTAPETLNLPDLSSGTYYIRVFGYSNANSQECYTLKATTSGGNTTNSCVNAYEPNESISSAKAISSGSSIEAAIGSSGDNDYFSTYVPSNGTLNVELVLSGIDLDFHVYNSSGTEVGKAVNGGTTAPETLNLPDLSSDTYYIRVFGYSNASSQECYTLKATTTVVKMAEGVLSNNSERSLLEGTLSVYPNPAQLFVNVVVPKSLEVQMLEVYDVYGKLLFEQPVMSTEKVSVNIAELTSGVYLIRGIGMNGKVKTIERFIKE